MSEFKTGVIRPVECYKEGWELIKDQYWLLFGITLVGALIGGATLYILFGGMVCGIFYCYFQKFDGRQIKFEDLFKGFNYILPGFIVVLFIVVPVLIVYGGIYFPFIAAIVMGSKLSSGEFTALLTGSLIFDFIFVVLMVCLHTLLMFSFPLIVDRNLSGFSGDETERESRLAKFERCRRTLGGRFRHQFNRTAFILLRNLLNDSDFDCGQHRRLSQSFPASRRSSLQSAAA